MLKQNNRQKNNEYIKNTNWHFYLSIQYKYKFNVYSLIYLIKLLYLNFFYNINIQYMY